MPKESQPINAEQVEQIIKTAEKPGVEVDETGVTQWFTRMTIAMA